MLNLIDACTVILILTHNTYAVRNSSDGLFNVGTVLFTSDDLYKKRWSRTNIEILQARKHFQHIFPSPSMDSLNENYINNLLKYFTNAFSTLKREAIDPGFADIMERALSDAVGGYFKVWVLPVTKLTYYGGAVTQEDAIRVFEFYDKLKRSLNTDGSRWRKPSEIIFNTIAITVVPFSHLPRTRSMKYPCENLAYFEQSDAGLSIPTPLINWNEPPYSMFLPLKNESIIQLDSPSASKALLKYYDVAESCCQSKGPDACSEFDLRFQDWVSNNVVPHINDDKLYIAFGNLLSLLHKTDDYIQKASNLCEFESDAFTFKSLLSRLPPCMISSKCFILILILIVEIIWCVPALIYIICSRRKSRMKQRTKFFLDAFKRRKYHTVARIDKSEERTNFVNKKDTNDLTRTCQSHMDHGVKLVQKPRERNREVLTQCPSHNFTRSTGQVTSIFSNINNEQECQCASVTLINEKIVADATHSSHTKLTVSPECKDMANVNVNQTESYTKIQKLETTITKIIRDKSSSNSKPSLTCPSSNRAIKKMQSEVKEKLQELQGKDETESLCPCTCCIEKDKIDIKAKRPAGLKELKSAKARDNLECVAKARDNLKGVSRPKNVTNVTNKTKLPKVQPKACAPKNIKLNQTKGLKLNSGEPLLEIRIDRPAAEITVDITKTCRKNVRPSKIPRLAAAANAKGENTLDTSPRNVKPCICIEQASNTVKKRAVDDSGIKGKVVKHKKLNVTL